MKSYYLCNVYPSKNPKMICFLYRSDSGLGETILEERPLRLFSDRQVEERQADRVMPSFYFYEPTSLYREWATTANTWRDWQKVDEKQVMRSQTSMPVNIATMVQQKIRLGDAHPNNPSRAPAEFVPVLDCCFDIETTGLDKDAEDAMVLTICAQLTLVFGDASKKVLARAVFQLGVVDWSFSMMKAHRDRARAEGVRFVNRDFVCDPTNRDSCLWSEMVMLKTFSALIQEWNPDSISGHNIERFDLPYVETRMACFGEEMRWGRDGKKATLLPNGSFVVPHRMILDTAVESRSIDVKGARTLRSLGTEFLGETKEDMDYREIVPCFRGSGLMRARLASYCLQDAVLPVELALKWNTFPGKFAIARMTFSTLGYGTMPAILATYNFYALYGGLTAEEQEGWTPIWMPYRKNSPVEHNYYVGGHVFDMVPGFYENYVITLDYASLYPRTMQAHNLCGTTLVTEEQYARLPQSEREKVEMIRCEASMKKKVLREQEKRKRERERKQKERLKVKAVAKNSLEKYFGGNKGKEKEEKEEKEEDEVDEDEDEEGEEDIEWRTYYFYRPEHRKGLTAIILTAFLALRAEHKALKKQAIKDGNDMLAAAYDAQQLADKLVSNRTYGLFATNAGAEYGQYQGLLPLVPVAEATTAWGRRHIKDTATFATTEGAEMAGVPIKLIGGDSVTGKTPVLLRFPVLGPLNRVVLMRIDEIEEEGTVGGGWTAYGEDKEQWVFEEVVEVWSETGWTRVRRLIRHLIPAEKKVFEVTTHRGVVEVTEDHSLLAPDGREISAKDVAVGTDLMHSSPFSIMVGMTGMTGMMGPMTMMGEVSVEEAWIMGLFFADGSAGVWGSKAGWRITKNNRGLMEKVCAFGHLVYPQHHFAVYDIRSSSKTFCATITNPKTDGLVEFYRENFYDKEGNKRVPSFLFSAPEEVRRAFLEGYYAGDGSKTEKGRMRMDTKGQIGAAGLFLLLRSLGYFVSVNTREDKPGIFRLNASMRADAARRMDVKKIREVKRTDRGPVMVYDFETSNHHFAAGVGEIVVHNTDSVILHVDVGGRDDAKILSIGKMLTDEFNRRLPPPELLEFETVHSRYLYVKKKNYAATSCEVDGGMKTIVESSKAKIRGLACIKSDTLPFVAETQRHLLRSVLRLPFERTEKDLLPSKLFTLDEVGYLGYEQIIENVLRNLLARNMSLDQLKKTIKLSKPVESGQGPQYEVARWMLEHPSESRMPPQQYDSVSFIYAIVERKEVKPVPVEEFGRIPLSMEKYVELLRSGVMVLEVMDPELERKWKEMVRNAPRSVEVSERSRKFLKLE